MTRQALELLEALLWQMNRDRPSTGDLLPNRAGEERRAKAGLIQGYIDTLEPIAAALRAQAEAEAGLKAENAVLRAFVEAFADEDGCGCGYSDELLRAYGAAYDLMWPQPALAQAGGDGQ